MRYAVLDIEASGGKAGTEKIIEIAIYQFDGQLVTDQFGSMVNPQKEIDPYVQKLTGITDKMVRRAPKFYELAKRVIDITEDCIIVGHGVNFDYRMLRQEFKELGYNFERPTLDTLTLSQQLIPGMEAYSLGKLAKSLGIPVNGRHRADGDTRATLELFKLLLEKDAQKNIIQTYAKKEPSSSKQINKLLNLETNLPNKAGVFYMHNSQGKIIHLGAARNISGEINKIFTQKNQNAYRIQSHVEKITFELTGSLLIALIKRNDEQTKFKNLIHTKNEIFNIGLFPDNDLENLEVDAIQNQKKNPLLVFDSKKKALKTKDELLQQRGQKSFKSFVARIKKNIKFPFKDFIILDKGRTNNEKSFIEVNNYKIIGYGYYTFYNQLEDNTIRETIRISTKNSGFNIAIIRSFIKLNRIPKIVPIKEDGTIKIPQNNERKRRKNKR